jgi:hypothetical protein
MVRELLNWIQGTMLSITLRRSDWAIMGFESVHLLGLSLLGGAVTIAALAALRADGLRGLRLTSLLRQLRPLMATGLALMAASGALIAWSMPYRYYLNPAFRAKMLLLVPAVLLTACLTRWLTVSASNRQLRAVTLLAWSLWLAVGISGRLIGYL